ncbi:MAG: hypothetical protein GX542_08565 [Rhodococcus sp.]|nr:hypothetical protein [Rhodococcus sp. (in: high G+C Gram-positive bacteria)]
MSAPSYTSLWMLGQSRSPRYGARVRNAFWHTQEGDSSAANLAHYLNNSANGVSYHDVVRDGIVAHVVDDDYAAWSVLSANPYSYNLCFAGSRASWSEAQWMRRSDDICIAVWLTLEVARRKGFAADILAERHGVYRRGDGIADHYYVTRVLGIGTHTDCGPGFPWWFARECVRDFVNTNPVHPITPNAIDEEHLRIGGDAGWIGRRLHPGEKTTPDGVGRFVEFERGHIYWTPEIGAKAVPAHLFEAWAGYGWETGALGYPVCDHQVLTGPDGQPWGDVQNFERGTLYRRYGHPGFYVHGFIGSAWDRSGFENGPLGWPTSLESGLDNGDRVQEFERGRIFWSPTGTITLAPQDGPDQHVPVRH